MLSVLLLHYITNIPEDKFHWWLVPGFLILLSWAFGLDLVILYYLFTHFFG